MGVSFFGPSGVPADAAAAAAARTAYCDEKFANREIRVWHFVKRMTIE
jgi:hypothetical protein